MIKIIDYLSTPEENDPMFECRCNICRTAFTFNRSDTFITSYDMGTLNHAVRCPRCGRECSSINWHEVD
jgi:hypothetical protein